MTAATYTEQNVKFEYFDNLLQRIKETPERYLGKPSITRLRMFLDGYGMARCDLGFPRGAQNKEFSGFQDWIQTKFNITSSHGWNDIILFYSVDERDGLDNFFKLLEQFCNDESGSRDIAMKEKKNGRLDFKSEYLYDMLQNIKQRPGMYLGKCSITRLNMLLAGYAMARAELGLPVTEQEKEFGGFQDWIQERYKMTSSHGWDSIILFYSADEREALNKFFELFEKFRNGESASLNQVCTEKYSGSTPQLTQEMASRAD